LEITKEIIIFVCDFFIILDLKVNRRRTLERVSAFAMLESAGWLKKPCSCDM